MNDTYILKPSKFKGDYITKTIDEILEDNTSFEYGGLSIQKIRTKSPRDFEVNKIKDIHERVANFDKVVINVQIFYKNILIFEGNVLNKQIIIDWDSIKTRFKYTHKEKTQYVRSECFGSWFHYGKWIQDVEMIIDVLKESKRVHDIRKRTDDYFENKQLEALEKFNTAEILATYNEV